MNKPPLFIAIIISTLFTISQNSAAQDHPTIGIVYNTIDASSLTYQCEIIGSGILNCEFIQASVRKNKLTPDELTEKMREAEKRYKENPDNLSPEQCEKLDRLEKFLAGGSAPPDAPEIPTNSPEPIEDVKKSINSLSRYCKDPTLDNFLNIIEIGEHKKNRTCSVGGQTFSQKFQQTGYGAWVVLSKPTGVCGTVQLDRFELDKDAKFGIGFWTYTSRKVITNPGGEYLGLSCKEMDENEYKYDWKQRELYLECDYIEFSPY